MGSFDFDPRMPRQPPITLLHGARLDRWWGRRHIAETGEALQEHRPRTSSPVAIVVWIIAGIGLLTLAVIAWSMFVLFTVLLGLLGVAALGTGIGKWRENRWLKPPKA
jgi:hypothetical protein